MHITIRKATPQDAEAIARLNREAMGYEYPTEATAQKLRVVLCSDRDRVFVAVAEGAVVGYAHANDYDVLYFPTMKNIMGIAVDSAYRRCGIGRQLLNAVEAWAKETGADGIRLVSGAARTNAHAFYRKCGFTGGKEQINFKKSIFLDKWSPIVGTGLLDGPSENGLDGQFFRIDNRRQNNFSPSR